MPFLKRTVSKNKKIPSISALKLQTEESEEKSDDEFEKEFAALEAEERKNNNEI